MLRFRYVLFCLPLFSFSLFAEDRVPDDTAVLHSFQLAPSYFIGNSVNAKTGKRLVDNSEVVAFVQTQKGRVLFSPSGVHIGVACNQESLNATKQTSYQPIEDVLDSSGNRGVVMQVGIPDETKRKRKVLPRLEERAPGVVNFLIGNEANWQTNLPTYRKLVYDQVWKGITLEYLGYQDRLEFQFLVEPLANPKQIHLETGADELEINEDGTLSAKLSGAELILSRPFAYQLVGDQKKAVAVSYRIVAKGQFGFEFGAYNRHLPIVLVPEITWSTFLGGSGNQNNENATCIVVDDSGNAYVAGFTLSSGFPTTTNAIDRTLGGSTDGFIFKLNEDASDFAFSTYLGGGGQDWCRDLAFDNQGQVIVVGETSSSDFPTTSGAYDQRYSDRRDVFACKLNSDGTGFIFSTFLGERESELAGKIVVDGNGNLLMTGTTYSNRFPTTTGALDPTFNGGSDAFLVQLNANGSELLYSSFLGGNDDDRGYSVATNYSGDIFLSGFTSSGDFPVTPGAFDETYNGGRDLFLCQLNLSGNVLEYSSYLGGIEDEQGPFGALLNNEEQLYVYGYTESSDFPVTPGSYDSTYNGNGDYFVCKFDFANNNLVFSSFLGGSDEEEALDAWLENGFRCLGLDEAENLCVIGSTRSLNFPTTPGAYNQNFNGGYRDVVLSKISSDGKTLLYSTFLGGSESESGHSLEIDLNGNAYLAGRTSSEDFPITPGVIGNTRKHVYDVFVTKLDLQTNSLEYSNIIGGHKDDYARGLGIERDDLGNLYIVGTAISQVFPITQGAAFPSYNGYDDVFISKINPNNNELIFSTFLGGANDDEVSSLALDSSWNVYLTGFTNSEDFPTTINALDPSFNGLNDAYVAKLNPTGTSLEFSTFVGGADGDGGSGIGLDVHSNIFVTGFTRSPDFPTTLGSFDETHNGRNDVFICKLNSNGTTLLASSFFGGTGDDYIHYQGNHLVLDAFDSIYIAGTTDSLDIPLTNGAFDTTFNGGEKDVFVVKMNSDLSDLGYATYLGGTSLEMCSNLGIDNTGSLYVFGGTWSDNFPVTVEAFDTSYNGGSDCYLTKVAPNGTYLIYSTFIGGSDFETSRGGSIDAEGNAVLVGDTTSTNFPTTLNAFDDTHNGSSDAFTFCLNQTGRTMFFSTYLGGSGLDVASGIEIDDDGFAYITGYTQSSEFPVSNPTFDDDLGEGRDAFVAKFKYCDSLSFLSQPSSTVRCVGDSVLFSIEVLGSDPISYQWKKDGIDISGADTEVFQIDTLELDDFGIYSVFVSNPCGSIQSQDFELRLDAPQILSEQGFQRTCVGESLRLTVMVAEVPNLTYQWRKDGLDLPGQNQPHLDLDPVVSGDMGHYSCYICNDCSCIESTPFGVDVDGPIVEILPNSVAQGLDNIVLTASVPCSHGPTTVEWENLNTHEVNTENPLEVGVQLQTVQFRATVTDDNAETATAIATILVHENDILDFNGDQCNDLQDLWDIMTFWGQSYPMDPNSDQHIDIRDFLYINIQDPLGCP